MSQSKLQLYEDLTASIPGVIYQFLVSHDGSWHFPFVSKGIETLFEVSQEDALHDADIMTSCIIMEDRQSHRESVEHAVRNFIPWHHEHRIRTNSGKLKWIRGTAVPRLLPDGSVLWSGMLDDITELMNLKLAYTSQNSILKEKIIELTRAEVALTIARDNLENLVAERTLKLEEERRGYTQHLLDAIEQERIRIARELHDDIGQSLTLLAFDVDRIQREALPVTVTAISDSLEGMSDSINKMVTTVQRICSNLRPALLDDFGFVAAIEWECEGFSRRSGVPCSVIWKGELCQNYHCGTNIFRIVQESLNNIAKYAHATKVSIVFTRSRGRQKIVIRDNGLGFNPDIPPKGSGYGIIGMRERATSIGALFNLKNIMGKGTVITIDIPCGNKEPCGAHTDH